MHLPKSILRILLTLIPLTAMPQSQGNNKKTNSSFQDFETVTLHGIGLEGRRHLLEGVRDREKNSYYLHSKENQITVNYSISTQTNTDEDPLYFLKDDFWGVPGKTVQSWNNHIYDGAAVEGYLNLKKVMKETKKIFGFDSFDNQGTEVILVLMDSGNGRSALILNNAKWWKDDQNIITVGRGDGDDTKPWSVSLTVIAHEFAHGIINATSKLGSEGIHGSLNEAFADIFSYSICKRLQVAKPCHLFGHELYFQPGQHIRNIRDPDLSSNASHLNQFEPTNKDIYFNAGIITRAFVLFSEKVFVHEAGKIFFDAFTKHLDKTSSFTDVRRATIKAAKENGLDSLAPLLNQAWSEVGIL